ncbi:M20/M25/M40 family metallo-hydrolase [Thalassoglobus sp. JC818]|uniref:M20/M25/M40 family metallo-hydrolase n=1 Tax=Thalassoglobus sp. JC818 TaxID=3232136 RepID=UPI00345AE734
MSLGDSNKLTSLVDDAAVDLVLEMIAVPGKSGEEAAIAKLIVDKLHEAGVDEAQISFDEAHTQSHLTGQNGNLIVDLPGNLDQPRRLLMAHIDTVPLCVGAQPVRENNIIRSADSTTALGGDNRAGAAVVLNTIRLIQQHNLPHPPLTILFAIQEEVGLIGARYVDQGKLQTPTLGFNWDGGRPEIAVIGATGDDHIEIEVHGIASHAGAHPEHGVSAAIIAARAIQSLAADGWLGLIEKGKQSGTSNIGIIQGGAATNVVMDHLKISAEARSHNPEFRSKIVKTIQRAFEQSAKETMNTDGKSGRVKFTTRHKYESFQLDPENEVVKIAQRAVESIGLTPETRISNGGLDANWMNAHGLPTITLGCGQSEIHTVKEQLFVDQFLNACRIGLTIGTATV